MLKSYFKIALRNLTTNKATTFINVFGLAVGLITCLLIMLYVFDESSFDKNFENGDRIFRVASKTVKGDAWAAGPGPLAAGLKNNFPEVEASTRLLTFPDIATMLVKYEEGSQTKQLFESNGYYVDSTFFQLFRYDFIYGNPVTALTEPNSTVISNNLANKLFGKQDPVGKVLVITTPFGDFNYTVKAVFDGEKNKSHIPANYFLSMRNNDMWNWVQKQTRWTTNNIFFSYIKLKDGANPVSFEKKINVFFEKQAGDDLKAAGISKTLFLQPLTDIYLHSSIGNEIAANGNITYLYILGSIAIFILLIACINFMNLSTAQSQKRAREVGVRKVMGALRKYLITQFLGESLMLCFIALLIAFIGVSLFLPVFNELTEKNLNLFNDPSILVWIIALTLGTGLLSGLYPAFYLSAFKPVSVLKGKIVNSFSATAIRKGLVVFQFTISTCLIFGAVVVWRQLDMVKNQQLGFNKEHQIVFPMQQSYKSSESSFVPLKNELLKNKGVKEVTSGSAYPGIANLSDMLFYPEGKSPSETVDIHLNAVETDYIKTLGIKIVSGRSFAKEFTADSSAIILNETAVKELGYKPADAVGKNILYDFAGFRGVMKIIGVVKDFNFESLHNEIKPYGFTSGMFANKYSFVIASLQTSDYTKLLSDIKKTWTVLNPGTPFVYSFIDQDFHRNYEKEERTSRVISYFTLIAIVIACLGLFGLAAFSAEQRTKEIGIRKVLGASISNVATLLSKDFIKLVMIALTISLPFGWFVMNQWLQDFAYRISISWWMFLIAGVVAVLIALITVSFHAMKAAVSNPVKSLRSE
jgi:putative ABC transport system permease protein